MRETKGTTLPLIEEARRSVSRRPAPPVEADAEDLLSGIGVRHGLQEVRAALEANRWHIEKSAKSLGLDRHQMRRLMIKHGLER